MKLTGLTVERFRSITKAYKVRLENYTVFVGPNNEGKSNILRALTLAMKTLSAHQGSVSGSAIVIRMKMKSLYEWKTDFPLHLQNATKQPSDSVVTLEMQLELDELVEFQKTTSSKLNGTLVIAVKFGPDGFQSLTVLKQGPAGKALTKKSLEIAKFVTSRLRFEHIPAVRTAQSARRVVEDLVALELKRLESDPAYAKTVAQIAAMQEPVLLDVSRRIRDTLLPFLPSLARVEVTIPDARRLAALRHSCSVYLDDGARTLLEHKGDGIQSLAALGLMRDASGFSKGGVQLVIAIEEPESHLHPKAIHELRALLWQLKDMHQIVVTTHSAAFIDRNQTGRNIIVRNKLAKPAGSLAELRDALGVQVGDNLQHALLVLVVEGEWDVVALSALFAMSSKPLGEALRNKMLSIEALHGSTNLPYKLGTLRASLYPYHVFLDADEAGRTMAKEALRGNQIAPSEISYAALPGRAQTELEDWFDPIVYQARLEREYNVRILPSFTKGKTKWSGRMATLFSRQSQVWDDQVKAHVKRIVAEEVSGDPVNALLPHAVESMKALVTTLEKGLKPH